MEPAVCPPIKRQNLAILLQRLEPLPNPRAELEQYQTPAEVAAHLLFKAFGMRDVLGRTVADLGCGNGILAIGAARLGAGKVIAVDVDSDAIEVADGNASSLGMNVELRTMDVRYFRERVETVFMNPPFGGQRRHADIPFIEAALRCAPVTYSFHNAETQKFVRRKVESLGGIIEPLTTYKFPLQHAHPFHRKDIEEVDVDLYRIVRRAG
ncbi:MAG: METTL5 family protein [Candidatus Thermoplasmatota archaeon]|nr:METTL5 family protein [Candidatus Thermoplasmatota archaeon]